MKPNDIDMVEVVDHRADRPTSSDWGGQPICDEDTTVTDDDHSLPSVKPIYSTSEAAEFFDRSNQWLYWGLREKVFTHEDGTPIELAREGHSSKGRRRFTLPIIEAIMYSTYRRGNMSQEELKTVMRRIKLTRRGVEWREQEGWKYANMGRNRHRWVPRKDAMLKNGEWIRRPKTTKR